MLLLFAYLLRLWRKQIASGSVSGSRTFEVKTPNILCFGVSHTDSRQFGVGMKVVRTNIREATMRPKRQLALSIDGSSHDT